MTAGLIVALYRRYVLNNWQAGVKIWVVPSWTSDSDFISIDGEHWRIIQSEARPQGFAIPFDLFIRDEFSV